MFSSPQKILIFLFFWIFPMTFWAQHSFFVSPTGNDSNNGDFSHPWKSLQFSVNQLTAGDTLNIMAGNYSGNINLGASGMTNQEIIIKNWQQDEVIINGHNLPEDGYLIKINHQSHIQIQGIKFKDYQALDAKGLLIINSSFISILNCEFSNIDYSANAVGQTPTESQNAQPIIIFGRDPNHVSHDLLLQGNSIHDCETGWSEALSLNGNIENFYIIDNQIYNNTNIGIVAIGFEGECPDPTKDQARNGVIKGNRVYNNPSAYDAAAGIYIDGASNIRVENNISYQNDYGIEIGCENNGNNQNSPSANHIIVINNLIYQNNQAGIVMGGYNYPVTGKVENTLVRNNSLFDNDLDNTYSGEIYLSYVETSKIENNIIYTKNNHHVLLISENNLSGVDIDYNLYFQEQGGANNIVIEINGTEFNSFSAYQQSLGRDSHSVFADPLFQNEGLFDLHIKEQSPAINNGKPSTVILSNEKDIDNENRIENTRIDIGADEYSSLSNISDSPPIGYYPYPNPFVDKIYLKMEVPFSYQVFTIEGKLIIKGKSLQQNIDLSPLKSGIYLIEIFKNNLKNQTFKIIKQ